jgi:hypothetical protein
MALFGIPAPRSIGATAAAILIACSAPLAAEAAESSAERARELIDQIQEITANHGPYSSDLRAPLQTLALLYEEDGEHNFALVALERALQVVRVNSGLHTLDQVPLVLQRIRSEEARGNDLAAWELERELLTLVRRHPDDLRSAAVLREIADRQMATLRQYLDGEKTPEVVYGCFYKQWPTADGGSCTAGSRKIVVQGMFAEAQRNYADAITVMLRHNLYDSAALRDLETDLLLGVDMIRTTYERPGHSPMALVPGTWAAEHLEPWRSRVAPLVELASWEAPRSGGELLDEDPGADERRRTHLMQTYDRGRQSLSRLYAYEAASSSPLLVQAEALAQIADWDLLYSHNGQAVDGYERVLDTLRNADLPAESIDELFAPSIPVMLPAFKSNPLAHDGTSPTTGYIDVAFSITRFGRPRDVVIVAAVNATEETQERLLDVIRSGRFRPRVTDGLLPDVAPVAFRYYVHDSPLQAMAD